MKKNKNIEKNFVSEIEILSDPDIMRQLEEGKNAKTKDFEDLAKELRI